MDKSASLAGVRASLVAVVGFAATLAACGDSGAVATDVTHLAGGSAGASGSGGSAIVGAAGKLGVAGSSGSPAAGSPGTSGQGGAGASGASGAAGNSGASGASGTGGQAGAPTGSWTQASDGLPPGPVWYLAGDEGAPETVYAAGLPSVGLYKTADAGAHWTRADAGLPNRCIYDVVVDPGHPGTVYAFLSPALYRSVDGGDSWTHVVFDLGADTNPAAVAFDPNAPDTIYVGGNNVTSPADLYRSVDDGATWAVVPTPSSASELSDISVDAQDSMHLFVATTNEELLESKDAGKTWMTHALPAQSASSFGRFVYEPKQQILCLLIDFQIHRSIDGGATWSDGATVIDAGFDNSLRLFSGPTFYLVGDQGSPHQSQSAWSTDCLNWTTSKESGVDVATDASSAVYVANSSSANEGGVSRSADGSQTFSPVSTGIEPSTYALAMDASIPGTLYVDADPAGVYRSKDGGVSWESASGTASGPLGPDAGYHWILSIAAGGGEVLASDGVGDIFHSADGASTWSSSVVIPPVASAYGYAIALAFDPASASNGIAYASANRSTGPYIGVYLSHDHGETWAPNPTTTWNGGPLVPDPYRPGRVWTAGGPALDATTLYRSDDYGETWAAVALPMSGPIGAIGVGEAPNGMGLVYLGVNGVGIERSFDDGQTFVFLGDPKVETYFSLAVDPTHHGTLYVAGGLGTTAYTWSPHGILVSTDYGSSWTPWNDGLATEEVSSLVLDPNDASSVYASFSGSGVFKATMTGP